MQHEIPYFSDRLSGIVCWCDRNGDLHTMTQRRFAFLRRLRLLRAGERVSMRFAKRSSFIVGLALALISLPGLALAQKSGYIRATTSTVVSGVNHAVSANVSTRDNVDTGLALLLRGNVLATRERLPVTVMDATYNSRQSVDVEGITEIGGKPIAVSIQFRFISAGAARGWHVGYTLFRAEPYVMPLTRLKTGGVSVSYLLEDTPQQ